MFQYLPSFRSTAIKLYSIAAAGFVMMVACGSVDTQKSPDASNNGFWNPGTTTTSKVNLVLRKAQDNNIPYEVVKITKTIKDPWGSNEDFIQTDYEFNFNRISKSQCEKLKQLYAIKGEGDYQFTADIACADQQNYKLSQFLPPIVQATKSLAFKDELKANGDSVATNCWGTAYEFARLATDGVNAFFTDDKTIVAAYAKNKTKKLFEAQIKNSTTAAKLFANAATKQLQTGDLIMIHADGTTPMGTALMHAAVYIDEGLVFQKWAGPEVFTYQINTYDYVFTQYGAGHVHKFVRPLHKFAPAKETVKFSCNITTTGLKICDKAVFVPFSKGPSGNYSIKQGNVW